MCYKLQVSDGIITSIAFVLIENPNTVIQYITYPLRQYHSHVTVELNATRPLYIHLAVPESDKRYVPACILSSWIKPVLW